MRRPPCGFYGDVDMDGWVTEHDAHLILKYLHGEVELSPEQLARADVNGDGRVNVIDAGMISQYAAGVREDFPVCPAPWKVILPLIPALLLPLLLAFVVYAFRRWAR